MTAREIISQSLPVQGFFCLYNFAPVNPDNFLVYFNPLHKTQKSLE